MHALLMVISPEIVPFFLQKGTWVTLHSLELPGPSL